MIKEPMRKVDPEIDLPVKGFLINKVSHHHEILWLADTTPLTEGMQIIHLVDSLGMHHDTVAVDNCIICEN